MWFALRSRDNQPYRILTTVDIAWIRKMFSSVFNAIHGVVTLFIGVFKICFKLISVSCSWALLLCIIVIFALSRYYRLRKPASNITERCFSSKSRSETDESIIEWWPIANRAACLDELENSKSAIEKVNQMKWADCGAKCKETFFISEIGQRFK